MNILIKNGQILDPANKVDEKLDILVVEGKIAKLVKPGSLSAEGVQVIDAAGIRPEVMIAIGGDEVRNADAAVAPDAEVHLLPAIAGG